MLTYNIHFTLQLLLILSYKASGVLKWSSAIKIETCTCWYYKYILRANLMLMLFNWWIFTYSHTFLHLFMYFFFSLHSLGSRVGSGAEGRVTPKLKVSHLCEDGFGKKQNTCSFCEQKGLLCWAGMPFCIVVAKLLYLTMLCKPTPPYLCL